MQIQPADVYKYIGQLYVERQSLEEKAGIIGQRLQTLNEENVELKKEILGLNNEVAYLKEEKKEKEKDKKLTEERREGRDRY